MRFRLKLGQVRCSVQDARKNFDKASYQYDSVREKFLGLRKNTKPEVVAEAEQDVKNARLHFEQCRFNLVSEHRLLRVLAAPVVINPVT